MRSMRKPVAGVRASLIWMRRSLIPLAALCAFSQSPLPKAALPGASVEGVISDAATGLPLADVQIEPIGLQAVYEKYHALEAAA